MTKNWDVVQDEIKELSFNQKKSLEEVKGLMEQKYKFRASTRAYRMKLKEWGLMRHKTRRVHSVRVGDNSSGEDHNLSKSPSAATDHMAIDSETSELRSKQGGWQVVSNSELSHAGSNFMGMLSQTPNLQPSVELPEWMQDPPTASDNLQDMLDCVLENDSQGLEKLLLEHSNEVNDPLGMPFELPSGRFANHPALSKMVIMQHPRQTLLDIACGMPNGPVVWVLMTYGAKGSAHPLGTDLALHNAIKNGRNLNVQALLCPGRSDVNGLPDTRWTPLLQAVFWTGPDTVSVLLKKGARVDDTGPSPTSPGMHTALQLCLERRAREYHDETIRSRCNENLRLLLKAGASIHVPPPEGSSATPFEKFIEPWQNHNHWSMRLSWPEIDCLQKFVEKGADLTVKFSGTPCAAGSSNTFIHQALWHSPPSISQHVVHSFTASAPASGTAILHEVIGTCADAKRHCAEALEYIELLLKRGVNPDSRDNHGKTALRKCIEQAPVTDVLALTRKLLEGGADPEHEEVDGIQPYHVAALNLEDPLRTEVLEIMLSSMQGHHTRIYEGRTYRWEPGLFPIPKEPTYQQVLACTKPDDDLRLSMLEMVAVDVQPFFQRAYLAVISSRLLNNISKAAITRKIAEKDRWDIMLTVSLRKRAHLPNYQFDQALVLNLLDFPNVSTKRLDASTTPQTTLKDPEQNTMREINLPAEADSVPAYQPFQLNSASPSTLAHPYLISRPSQDSSVSNDEFVGDTTQLRWLNPESTEASTPASAYVLQCKCAVCADDRLLTKLELQKHEVEHTHTAQCNKVDCARRFCKETRKRKEQGVGCQDHLFAERM